MPETCTRCGRDAKYSIILALGTLPDAQVLSPLSVRPVDASAGQPAPMLICPDCSCAWPELTPGTEDTVTCSCGRVLGCRVRR